MGKRVTWADKVNEELGSKVVSGSRASTIVKEGAASPELLRSRQLMDGLFKLRRVGGAEKSPRPGAVEMQRPEGAEGTEEQAKEQTPEDEQQLTLLNQTLSSANDTEAELRLTEAMLDGAHEPVAELGGARHATTLVSGRTLSVVKRKAHLCKISEAQLAAFEAADARRESLCKQLVAGEAEVPEGYRGADSVDISIIMTEEQKPAKETDVEVTV